MVASVVKDSSATKLNLQEKFIIETLLKFISQCICQPGLFKMRKQVHIIPSGHA